jgi:hypothetical protein
MICKDCFFRVFEDEVHQTVIENKLFHRGERVAIAASGGKGAPPPSLPKQLLLFFSTPSPRLMRGGSSRDATQTPPCWPTC